MVFWVEISLELLQFHRQKATFEENLNARRQDQDLKYSTNVIMGKSSFNADDSQAHGVEGVAHIK